MASNSLCCTKPIRHEFTAQLHSSSSGALPQFLFVFLLMGLFLVFATAQTPNPVTAMAYATIDEKTLHIQGGSQSVVGGGSVNQFFALDLTQSNWDIFNPPWKALAVGSGTQVAPVDSLHSMTVSKDKQSLIVWGMILESRSTTSRTALGPYPRQNR
ncbi:hypothetical protein BGX27_003969 [Mortierella sp. AM989]|nr:hypothetical protein BGX27_003969 [Mortierella sp. AM989]